MSPNQINKIKVRDFDNLNKLSFKSWFIDSIKSILLHLVSQYTKCRVHTVVGEQFANCSFSELRSSYNEFNSEQYLLGKLYIQRILRTRNMWLHWGSWEVMPHSNCSKTVLSTMNSPQRQVQTGQKLANRNSIALDIANNCCLVFVG